MKLQTMWRELCLRMRAWGKTTAWAVGGTWFRGETVPVGRLYATVHRADGKTEKLGLLSTKVVTDAGVDFIVDAFQNTEDVATMHFHASGTDNTAEATGNTALGAEVESRDNGSQTEGGSTNVFRTVGTVSYTATRSIVEHGVFSASSGGTLLDRSVFSAINVANGDSIEFTYDLTFPAGS